jgi:hypothetical protein
MVGKTEGLWVVQFLCAERQREDHRSQSRDGSISAERDDLAEMDIDSESVLQRDRGVS